MTLKLNGSSSGYTAIDATAAAGNNTLTLPTQAGTIRTTGTPGAILQVLQSVKTDTQTGTTSGTTYVDVLTQAITPSSASNKILINVSLACDIETNHYGMVAQLFRDSTAIMKSDASNSNIRCTFGLDYATAKKVPQYSISYLDSPNTTSSTTYKLCVQDGNGDGGTYFVNRPRDTSTNDDVMVTCSSITLMEVAG